MKVLILAAGYGTRLYPLIKDTPKSLLSIAERPLINYLLDGISDTPELQEVIVVTNNRFYSHFTDWAAKYKDNPFSIAIVNDGTRSPEDRLGSVGDISFALENHTVDDDLLVMGGDNLFDYPLAPFVQYAQEKNPAVTIGLYDIENREEAKKFGVVDMDSKGEVLSFEEKPSAPKSSLIAMCCYYFPKETFMLVAEYLGQSKGADKAGDYIHWLVQEKTVYGFQFKGKWYDIGSIEAYREAQKEFEARK